MKPNSTAKRHSTDTLAEEDFRSGYFATGRPVGKRSRPSDAKRAVVPRYVLVPWLVLCLLVSFPFAWAAARESGNPAGVVTEPAPTTPSAHEPATPTREDDDPPALFAPPKKESLPKQEQAPRPAPTVVEVVPVAPAAASTEPHVKAEPNLVELKPESKETAVPVTPAAPVEPELSVSEKDALERQRLLLSKARNPSEVFQFFRENWLARKYRTVALAMAFEGTNYTTPSLQQECLAKWCDIIIDRIEARNPRPFPTFTDQTDRAFRTAGEDITLQFVRDSKDCWQLGPHSIALTDEIYEMVRNDPPLQGDLIAQTVPPWMHRVVGGLSYFRWTILLFGVLFGLVVYWLIQKILFLAMRAYMHVVYQEVTLQSRTVWKQIALIVMAFIWFRTLSYVVANPRVYDAAFFVYTVFITIMLILIAVKIVDLLAEALRVRILMRNRFSTENVENLIVPFFSRTMKVLVVCIAIATLAQVFHWPLAAVLSGMGIGGIAIAFAAKETVANLFGSITVMIDRPFEIGDWIETGGIAGTVQSVGMRSTRIETSDFSIVTIPNNNLVTAVIQNLGRRRNRRFKTLLNLEYDTDIDRIDAFCEGIKELILKNAFTQKEGFTVCLYALSASSIDVLMNVVLVCPATETENRERAKLLRNILKLAERMDVRFAYPTQTLFLNRDGSEPARPLPGADVNPTDVGRQYADKILYPNRPPENDKQDAT